MKKTNRPKRPMMKAAAIAALTVGAAGAAQAQVVLGHHYRPHYWDLPTQFDQPFNFPGQTLLYNSTSKAYDDRGKRVDTGLDTDTIFGFTILPHFFKFDPASNWAFAFSLNTYELRIKDSNGFDLSGVGSVIPAFTGWTKPTPDSTIGFDILIGTPFSISSKLDSHLWDYYLRGFYDLNVNNWNIDAVIGYHTADPQRSSISKPKDEYHFNGRLGYDFRNAIQSNMRVTPYLSTDYLRNEDNSSHVWNVGAGLMVTHKDATTWSFGISRTIDGRNVPETRALLAQVWMPF